MFQDLHRPHWSLLSKLSSFAVQAQAQCPLQLSHTEVVQKSCGTGARWGPCRTSTLGSQKVALFLAPNQAYSSEYLFDVSVQLSVHLVTTSWLHEHWELATAASLGDC